MRRFGSLLLGSPGRPRARARGMAVGLAAVVLGSLGANAEPLSWWPPAVGPVGAPSPMAGWAMSEEGPMFMPRPLREVLYGPAGSLSNKERLREVLRRIWEHLAAEVDSLGELEAKSALYEDEVRGLQRRGVKGRRVVDRLLGKLRGLADEARELQRSLAGKFQDVSRVEGKLQAAYPSVGEEIRGFYRSLREAGRRTDEHAARLRRRVGRSSERLAALRPEETPHMEFLDDDLLEGPAPEAVSDLAAELAALEAPEGAPDAVADDQLYGGTPAAAPHLPVDPGDAVVPAPEPPYAEGAPTPGEDWLYTAGGRRRSAKELVRARLRQLRSRSGGTDAGADGEALPGAAGLAVEGGPAPEEIRKVGTPPPASPPGDDRDAEWWSPSAPEGDGSGDALYGAGQETSPGAPTTPLQPPGAEKLLDEFLSSPNVMDPHLSKRPDGARSGRRLLAAAPRPSHRLPSPSRAPPPPPRDPGLGEFARQLELELREASAREGLDPRRGFGPARPRVVPEPAQSGPTSVRDILAELEALERE